MLTRLGQIHPLSELEQAAPRLLDLYRGVFLAGEADSARLLVARDRLTVQFRRLILRLGEHWGRAGRWPEAAQLYERDVERDPLAETFYRRLMECLRQQRQHVAAIEIYLRCRQMLSVVLGVKPAPETEALCLKAVAATQR
jgi:DNA-binding SARP family transcriptional activator